MGARRAGMMCGAGGALLLLLVSACGLSSAQEAARIVKTVPWAMEGSWLPADLHVHTRFSDGGNTVEEVIARAREFGCRVIAITDHADRQLRAATAAYQADIEAARAANPDMVILAGLEWNIPPRSGDEHATVLAPSGPDEWSTLAEFKARFDDYDLQGRPTPDAAEALRWLATRNSGELTPVVIANHPSRKDDSAMDNVDQILAWRQANDLVVGFEGAPGHQGDDPIGSYDSTIQTVDRWDPAAADSGGAWDTLLARGIDIHGALAGSDFHTANPRDLNDPWPCEFSETWLYVPEETPAGVLRALRAGAFFGVHGHIARGVELTLSADGLERPAVAGEIVEIPAPSQVTATVHFAVADRDWRNEPNRIDAVDFIIATDAGVVTSTQSAAPGVGRQSLAHTFTVGERGAVVRVRGRRVIDDGPDLLFYTNAIRAASGIGVRQGGSE